MDIPTTFPAIWVTCFVTFLNRDAYTLGKVYSIEERADSVSYADSLKDITEAEYLRDNNILQFQIAVTLYTSAEESKYIYRYGRDRLLVRGAA